MTSKQRTGVFLLTIVILVCAILAVRRFDLMSTIKRLHGIAVLPSEGTGSYGESPTRMLSRSRIM